MNRIVPERRGVRSHDPPRAREAPSSPRTSTGKVATVGCYVAVVDFDEERRRWALFVDFDAESIVTIENSSNSTTSR